LRFVAGQPEIPRVRAFLLLLRTWLSFLLVCLLGASAFCKRFVQLATQKFILKELAAMCEYVSERNRCTAMVSRREKMFKKKQRNRLW